jgi:hypothetical protein
MIVLKSLKRLTFFVHEEDLFSEEDYAVARAPPPMPSPSLRLNTAIMPHVPLWKETEVGCVVVERHQGPAIYGYVTTRFVSLPVIKQGSCLFVEFRLTHFGNGACISLIPLEQINDPQSANPWAGHASWKPEVAITTTGSSSCVVWKENLGLMGSLYETKTGVHLDGTYALDGTAYTEYTLSMMRCYFIFNVWHFIVLLTFDGFVDEM